MFSLASSPPHIPTPAPLALFVRFARRSDVGAFRAQVCIPPGRVTPSLLAYGSQVERPLPFWPPQGGKRDAQDFQSFPPWIAS